ncbi:LytR/AlgR family response regulator transcription factor [Arachidicoccus soli]|jgi:DNA-binding LytR/AlgR family response regulator|uniref:DNA-binding response regulator n=1 Tax=Arachidicoccus soli TaxID=2341117 RepID=A0A386HSE8_9BACT|nr:LytTR family DNA-binding domain-containing protein [Arachidicoccus soli]AYD48579.1 DNA-binding response regulator [Arachidicoccus soli]
MKVLIIEDEIKAAKELESLLHEIRNDIEVCAFLQSIEDTINWFKTNEEPDLIFSDISLADGVSFDIFKEIAITAPIIFCTAYNEFALQAFENNGFDYLLKPIEKEKLQKSFSKLKQLKAISLEESDDYKKRLHNLMGQFPVGYKSSLLTYFRGIITPVNTSEISFIYTDNERNFAVANAVHFELRETLDNLMTALNPQEFYRANRQFIIHRKSIDKIETLHTRKLLVSLCDLKIKTVIVSKAKATDFLKWVEGFV